MKSQSKLKQIEAVSPACWVQSYRQGYAAMLYKKSKNGMWFGGIYKDGEIYAEMVPVSSFKQADIALYAELSKIQVEEINLMSRQPFMESLMRDYYCSPSSESYWSA